VTRMSVISPATMCMSRMLPFSMSGDKVALCRLLDGNLIRD
jgi:hypothetical protein